MKNLWARASGNGFAQSLLERNVRMSQFLMGIGSGAGVQVSGEVAALNLLLRTHKPPYCIFDIGSNKGQYLGLVTQLLANTPYTLHCFEPSVWTFDKLKENALKKENVRLNNMALGKSVGEAVLYYNKQGSGLASFSKRRLEHFNIQFDQSETVRVGTVDQYCSDQQIDRIHLMKMDVEGHELEVLEGSSTMLERGAIDIIVFEFGGCNIDTRCFFQDFYYLFSALNMKMFRVTPSGYLYPIYSYHEIFEQFRTTNYVAVRNE